MNKFSRFTLILLVVAPSALLAGCSGGDDGAVSPDQMSEIRKKQESERGATPPADSRPPTSNR